MLWNCVTQIEAAKISRNMYNNDSSVGVESDLVNSYAWDTAIVFIQEMGNNNYANKADGNGTLKNTGTTGDEICNIYDMASNCFEWDTEYAMVTTGNNPCVFRGGYYIASNFYTAKRHYKAVTLKYAENSFRVVLYVK